MQAHELPDVLAYSLEDAVLILEKAGIKYTVQKTNPPKHKANTARVRVVRQRFRPGENMLQLTVMPEIW
ncbi:MAG: PASTA domain-containing protein [Firmicutes bacterium]|nr:PASTA domain-containing protein [Bacillota bacterium]